MGPGVPVKPVFATGMQHEGDVTGRGFRTYSPTLTIDASVKHCISSLVFMTDFVSAHESETDVGEAIFTSLAQVSWRANARGMWANGRLTEQKQHSCH